MIDKYSIYSRWRNAGVRLKILVPVRCRVGSGFALRAMTDKPPDRSIPTLGTSLRQGFGWQAVVLAGAARRSLLALRSLQGEAGKDGGGPSLPQDIYPAELHSGGIGNG
jgi:hypothetical protein